MVVFVVESTIKSNLTVAKVFTIIGLVLVVTSFGVFASFAPASTTGLVFDSVLFQTVTG